MPKNKLSDRSQELKRLHQAKDDLVKSGDLVAIEEIDPETGKPRFRYYHRDYAPKPN
jgi:hypothetical protein